MFVERKDYICYYRLKKNTPIKKTKDHEKQKGKNKKRRKEKASDRQSKG